MSERAPSNAHEKHTESHESHKDSHDRIKHQIEKNAEKSGHEHKENIEKIRAKIHNEADQERKKIKHESENKESDQPTLVNKEIKDIAYNRTLKKVQSKLSYSSRTFSKLIHQPTVEKISELTSKTVARPSGILFGGIFSFIGSSFFLWAAKYYGYEYNFLLFIIFFVTGFFVGLILEMVLYAIKRK